MRNGLIPFLRQTGGTLRLAARTALRTRTVGAVLVLLAACVGLLPRAVHGDGTPSGDMQILLQYTLGFAFFLLCLATLWSACALLAAEIDSRRIHLTAVKPVRAISLWLGRWLALLAIQAALLAVIYLGTYAQLHWRMRRDGWRPTDRPASRRVTRPLLPPPREEARAMLASMRASGTRPQGVGDAAILRALETKAREKFDVVNPGQDVRWRFRLGRPLRPGGPLTVRLRFDSEYSTREHVRGVCRIWPEAHPERAVEHPLDNFTLNEIAFPVDTRAFAGASGRDTESLREFVLSFRHAGEARRVSALMLRFRQDVALLTAGGSFEANLARAALLQWAVLALLAAFGLTLSACFSMPVAAFVATLTLALTLLGHSVVRTVSVEEEQAWRNRIGIWVSRGISSVTSRAVRAEPLTSLTRGERIGTDRIGETLLWNALLLPLGLAGVGVLVLRRREWADTESCGKGHT